MNSVDLKQASHDATQITDVQMKLLHSLKSSPRHMARDYRPLRALILGDLVRERTGGSYGQTTFEPSPKGLAVLEADRLAHNES